MNEMEVIVVQEADDLGRLFVAYLGHELLVYNHTSVFNCSGTKIKFFLC